ncbi:MAG: hypothetical protein ACJLS2_02085 [Microcella pacifica]
MSDDTATDANAMGVPTLEEVAVVAGVLAPRCHASSTTRRA